MSANIPIASRMPGSNGSASQTPASSLPVRPLEAVPEVKISSPNILTITRQARQYAIAELARRAGVPADFFRAWKISVGEDMTVVEIPNGVQKQIYFPHVSPKLLGDLVQRNFPVARASWMDASASAAKSIPEFVIPFVEGREGRPPLFRPIEPNAVACTVDLPLSTLLTLSRWEESLDTPRDTHGRFVAAHSIAAREKVLDRPIVDEYGLAFEEALRFLFPTWPKAHRALRIKVSHDVDHVGTPFNWRRVLRRTIENPSARSSYRDLLSWFPDVEPTELSAVREIVLLSARHGMNSAVYWKASPPGPRDSGYNLRELRVRRVIDWLRSRGVELGVHPGYGTLLCPEKLRREVNSVREVLGDGPLGGRQHYLRWRPESWIHWENCGLAYDSSVGFAEEIGFRAGTCLPYRPWLFALNRRAELLEIPLLVMDKTLLGYMKLSPGECLDAVTALMNRCRTVGGIFTLLWHNDALLDASYREVYLTLLLNALDGVPAYNWQTAPTNEIS